MRNLILTACCLFVAPVSDVPAEEQGIDRPNIVFLLADDLGWTGLNCFGSDFYETPHLDRLAVTGMKFTNAYAACTVCSPTRASIMTGMYPARLHLTDFIAGQDRPYAKLSVPKWTKQLESRHVTIAEALKASGYRTGHFGKWHLNAKGGDRRGTDPRSQGFDVSVGRPKGSRGYLLGKAKRPGSGTGYLTDWLTNAACRFVAASKDQPFFLYFAYNVPHTPIQGRPDLVQYFRDRVEESAAHRNPEYAAMVKSLDLSVGRILSTLKDEGVAENTLVIFISDNGGLTQRYGRHDGFTENLPLRRGKGSAYEGGVRVPAIVNWPGVTPAGAVSDTPIITIDFYPTLLAASGAKGVRSHNANVDGRSLLPVFRNASHQFQRSLYWHYPHYHAGGDSPYSAVRSGTWKLIEFHEDQSTRLYNLKSDLRERQDLSQQLPERRTAMLQELRRWRNTVNAQMPTANPHYDPDKPFGRATGQRRQE